MKDIPLILLIPCLVGYLFAYWAIMKISKFRFMKKFADIGVYINALLAVLIVSAGINYIPSLPKWLPLVIFFVLGLAAGIKNMAYHLFQEVHEKIAQLEQKITDLSERKTGNSDTAQ